MTQIIMMTKPILYFKTQSMDRQPSQSQCIIFSKRGFRIYLLILFIFAGCNKKQPIEATQPGFGTFISITVWSSRTPMKSTQALIDKAFDRMHALEQIFNRFSPDSEISRLNHHGYPHGMKVSRELMYVLSVGQKINKLSHGAFTLTIGPLVKLYHFQGKGNGVLPSAQEIQQALNYVDDNAVILDQPHYFVRFKKRGIELDCNAIAKGYAADEMARMLITGGVTQAVVNAGGNLSLIGNPPNKKDWSIGIQHPLKHTQRAISTIEVHGGGIATSGCYENYFWYKGRRYSHILNPQTGYPVETVLSCTVTAPNAMLADAFSTCFYVLGLEKTRSLMDSRIKDIHYVMVLPEGKHDIKIIR